MVRADVYLHTYDLPPVKQGVIQDLMQFEGSDIVNNISELSSLKRGGDSSPLKAIRN